ncbi:thiamine pyrophosphate-binding protein [Exilibacterium tricleocarpae]|uniref:Thiamine pyrophosphate-binding protein n=1 Tax=Exilibacterium tricleocarpae TaxID=2591008 RepID=A0A545U8A1_9GAMM|nr:thiamine pyrophosphate-binding protein [Exilibacterium tricleocarpae]TQV85700.1 thiamine pyrophosphate-binding protein [Exilibacterium tricleocarpae]
MKANSHTALGARNAELAWEQGDLLLHYLEKLDVDYVFGVPGGAIEPLYNALARSERRGGPRSIVARHETGAAFMADGYSTQSGKLGVCCATSGPGATNLLTGVASAYINNVPLLVITGQTAMPGFGQGAFQESSCAGINTVGILEHCTHYSSLVSHIDQFEKKLVTAIVTACTTQRGPVHLSVPIDIMRCPAPARASFDINRLLKKPCLHDAGDIETLLNILADSRATTMVIGNAGEEAIGSILKVADHIGAQLLTTPHGKGLVNPYHPLFRGMLGYAGHSSAVTAISDPAIDTIICVGTLMSERAGKNWLNHIKPHQQLIHIDEVESHFTYTPMADLHVRGRLATIFDLLLRHTGGRRLRSKTPSAPPAPATGLDRRFTLDDEGAYKSGDTPLKPQRLMRELPRIFPRNTCFLVDSGAGLAWALHYLHPLDRRISGTRNPMGRLFRATVEFTSMGWAIGSAIGTALGRRGEPMVCITGDGSLLMSGQEITVAVQEQLPIVFIILNDSSLGMVKHGQRLTGAESIGNALPPTDFTLLAQSMGARAYTIRSPLDLARLDGSALCRAKCPTVIDVHIDPEAVPPLKNRIQTLTEN